MLCAYCLVYPLSHHAPPQLWEYEQPYIDNLILNAHTFDRSIVQWWFADWAALDRDNTRIWNTYYRLKPLYDHVPTWQEFDRRWSGQYTASRGPFIRDSNGIKERKNQTMKMVSCQDITAESTAGSRAAVPMWLSLQEKWLHVM